MTNILLQAFNAKAFIFKLFHWIKESYIRYVPVKGTGCRSLNSTIKEAPIKCPRINDSISKSMARKILWIRFEAGEYLYKYGIVNRGNINQKAAKDNRMFLSNTKSNIAIALCGEM